MVMELGCIICAVRLSVCVHIPVLCKNKSEESLSIVSARQDVGAHVGAAQIKLRCERTPRPSCWWWGASGHGLEAASWAHLGEFSASACGCSTLTAAGDFQVRSLKLCQ